MAIRKTFLNFCSIDYFELNFCPRYAARRHRDKNNRDKNNARPSIVRALGSFSGTKMLMSICCFAELPTIMQIASRGLDLIFDDVTVECTAMAFILLQMHAEAIHTLATAVRYGNAALNIQ